MSLYVDMSVSVCVSVCSFASVSVCVCVCLLISLDKRMSVTMCGLGGPVAVSLCLVPNTRMESIIQKGGISYIGFGLDLFAMIEKKVAGSVRDGWA